MTSIFLLVAGVVQGLSLCPCRAEQLAVPVGAHACDSGNADGRADGDAPCVVESPRAPRACAAHVQAKRCAERTGLAVAAVAEFDFVGWAEPRVLSASCFAADPPAGDSSLSGRSTPLLI